MSRSRAQRWIAMVGFLVAGCGSDAAARRTPVAPVAETPPPPVAPAAATTPSAATPAPAAAAPVETAATVAPAAPTAPVEVLPPCPTDPRDSEQLPDHVVQLVALSDAMTVVDLG